MQRQKCTAIVDPEAAQMSVDVMDSFTLDAR